ncbi:MAG TPA: FtsW/RodA/SpoVE family cell cycle protein [Candidatus Sulfotelmatobacter sp.]|nr:FtsW/RodA/SpoVE family cell cycle protein [Candidatus Sulfotelmatobacter sp.]
MTVDTLNEHESKLERLQLAAVLGLMIIGAMFIYSATMSGAVESQKLWYAQLWFRQIIWYALGIGAVVAVCSVSYHTLARWSFVIYWGMILCLVAVLIPHIGQTHNSGARRWIDLPFYQFQPSEFAKIAFVLAGANFLSRPPEELKRPDIFWKAIGLMALPFVLIKKEPDLGSALVLVPTGLVMMLVAGTPRKFIFRLVAVVGIVGVLFVADEVFAPPHWRIKIEEYQRQRLLVYFGRDFAAKDASEGDRQAAHRLQEDSSFQSKQALISVGSGGLLGAGWCEGKQTSLQFMPSGAAHNDFIFSVIAEEKGFVGSVTVLTLYAVVLFSGLRIAGQARDRLGKLIAVGVVTLLFSHVFVNIGMNIRIVPVTGIPLPLLSYGGSSVLCSLIALGLMQNVYIQRKGY